jgi:hypothetical protein
MKTRRLTVSSIYSNEKQPSPHPSTPAYMSASATTPPTLRSPFTSDNLLFTISFCTGFGSTRKSSSKQVFVICLSGNWLVENGFQTSQKDVVEENRGV